MSNYMSSWLIQILIRVPAVLICLSVHEAAHGYMAYALGDPTAKNAGRLTLDPLHHLDPIGTLCLLFFRVGWAKPVPINTRYFKHPRRDIALTALAGPLSNFVLALLGMFLCLPLLSSQSNLIYTAGLFCYAIVTISIGLGVFNLIPVPPLDGSKVLFSFLPAKTEWKMVQYQQYFQFGMLALLFIGVLDTPISYAINAVYHFLGAIVGLVY